MAEDRRKFSALLDELGDRPADAGTTRPTPRSRPRSSKRLGGFPVLVRPSYVLSGAAMSVAHETQRARAHPRRAPRPSRPSTRWSSRSSRPTPARSRSTPSPTRARSSSRPSASTSRTPACTRATRRSSCRRRRSTSRPSARVRQIAAEDRARPSRSPGRSTSSSSPRTTRVKVIECNLRASRSFPFVSKVTGTNYVAEAMRRMLGVAAPGRRTRSLDLDYVAVKAPMFSFSRLVGADPMLGVEMASTGEVGCFGDDVHEALLHALLATGFRFPKKGVLLSLGPLEDKYWLRRRGAGASPRSSGCRIFATPGTAEALALARHPLHQPRQGAGRRRGGDRTRSRTGASTS